MRMDRQARRPVIRVGASLLASASLLATLAGAAPVSAHRLGAGANGGVLTIAQQVEPDTLDNAHTILGPSYEVFSNIYDTLVVAKSTSAYEGEIAKSWTISDGGKVYTFQIRPGLKFSNGDPLNAAAVAFTFDRILNPATKSPDLGVIGPIESVKATGPLTVEFTLKAPFAYELADLAVPYAGIEDPKAVQAEGSKYGRDPVGSGPFMLKSWVSGESITLVPNPYYHGFETFLKNHGAPHLKELKYIFISNSESMVAALQSGEANMINQLPQANYAQFKSNPQFKTTLLPGQDINYLEFKTAAAKGSTLPAIQPPFNDIRVREAVGYAMNPAGMVQAANFGLGNVEYGFVPTGEDGHDPALKKVGFHFDPAQAKKLLTEAGWKVGAGGVRYKNGKPLAVTLWVFSSGAFPQDGQIIANELDAVGFKATVVSQELATFLAQYPKGNANMDVVSLGWPAGIMNVAMTLPLGTGNYPDPRLVKLLTEAQATANAQARFKLYAQAQAYSLKMAYAIPLYSDVLVNVSSASVHGAVFTANNTAMYQDVTVGG
jgi:peptide/nickel transport system substrate-binding protein